MTLLHTLHVPEGSGPFPTLLALHGWGASAHDLLGLAPLLPGNMMAVCPQGQVAVPIGPGQHGYGWFPLVPGQPPDPRAFLRGATELRGFVEIALERYPVDRRRVVGLGFSQGGLMAIDLVLRETERFAGLIVLSSWLPEILAANLPRREAHAGFPVLVIHGTRDPLVDVARARESQKLLADFGVHLTYEEFEMAHEIRPEALRKVIGWLRDNVLER